MPPARMNLLLSIPNDTINKFKCSLCCNYLSHFPISLTDEDKTVCGRCTIPEGKVVCHNKVFEEIAQHIKFPCKYNEQGCREELLPEDVPSHEKNCHFKIVKCPGQEFIDCSWQGARNDMLLHCRDSHQDMYLKDEGFELKLDDFSFQRFMEHDEVLFVVSLNHDFLKRTVSVMVYHIEEDTTNLENYPYQVVLGRNKTNIIVENVTTSFVEREFCKLALDSLTVNDTKETAPITGHVFFEKSVGDVNIAKKAFNDRFLSLLVCSSCGGYVLPPVQCLCKRLKCGFCNSFSIQLRCESRCEFSSELNEIVKTLNYPCRFKVNGCNALLKCEKMAKHIPICPFNDEYCDYCAWGGLRKDLKNHFFEEHRDLIVQNGEQFCVDNVETSLNRVIAYDNNLFVFQFKVEKCRDSKKKSYKWCVNLMKEIEEDFQYDIEIMNPEFSSVKILMQHKCFLLHQNDSCSFDDVSGFLRIKNSVVFKVSISKS